MNKLEFSLYDLVGVVLIVEHPSGVVYSNQTGGSACFQPSIEGSLLPVNIEYHEADYETSLEHRLRNILEETERLSAAQADKVDDLLARFSQTRGISVNRERLRQSHESWVHVTLDHPELGLRTPVSGVLTWPNSD